MNSELFYTFAPLKEKTEKTIIVWEEPLSIAKREK